MAAPYVYPHVVVYAFWAARHAARPRVRAIQAGDKARSARALGIAWMSMVDPRVARRDVVELPRIAGG